MEEHNVSETSQDSLDKKINDIIGPLLEQHKIENAIVIAAKPESDEIALFYRGHFYDVTCLLNRVLKKFMKQIDSELS